MWQWLLNLFKGKKELSKEEILLEALKESEIENPIEQDMFMAQMAHETGDFHYDEEIASGEAYEGRKDLGNTEPGDGKRFKGRGYIQITGRSNYKHFGDKIGIDLIADPEKAKDPEIAAKVAIAYWLERVNRKAARSGDVITVTRNINGGINGLEDRIDKFQYYQEKRRMLKNKVEIA